MAGQNGMVAHHSHGKIKFIMAKQNLRQRIQISPGKLDQNIHNKNKNSKSRNPHNKNKSLTAKPNGSQRFSVSGCPCTTLNDQHDVDFHKSATRLSSWTFHVS